MACSCSKRAYLRWLRRPIKYRSTLYGILREVIDGGEQIEPRLDIEPFITGIRGPDGRPYNSIRQRAKWVLRSATKCLAPNIWIRSPAESGGPRGKRQELVHQEASWDE